MGEEICVHFVSLLNFGQKTKTQLTEKKMDICWYSVIEAWLCNLLTNTNVRQ